MHDNKPFTRGQAILRLRPVLVRSRGRPASRTGGVHASATGQTTICSTVLPLHLFRTPATAGHRFSVIAYTVKMEGATITSSLFPDIPGGCAAWHHLLEAVYRAGVSEAARIRTLLRQCGSKPVVSKGHSDNARRTSPLTSERRLEGRDTDTASCPSLLGWDSEGPSTMIPSDVESDLHSFRSQGDAKHCSGHP